MIKSLFANLVLVIVLVLFAVDAKGQNCQFFSVDSQEIADNGDGTCDYNITIAYSISNCNNNSGALIVELEDQMGSVIYSNTFDNATSGFCSGSLTFGITTTCGATISLSTVNYDGPGNSDCPVITAPVEVTLPIELLSFEVKESSKYLQFDWVTASEINSNYFVIEHSTTGQSFRDIGRVTAQGNTFSKTAYQFVADKPIAGQHYFRLRMVDLNGTYSYGPIANIELGSAQGFSKNYHPDSKQLNLIFNQKTKHVTEVIVVDLIGGIRSNHRIAKGVKAIELPMLHLAQGLFYVSIQGIGTKSFWVR